jgi:hypothetical protein
MRECVTSNKVILWTRSSESNHTSSVTICASAELLSTYEATKGIVGAAAHLFWYIVTAIVGSDETP